MRGDPMQFFDRELRDAHRALATEPGDSVVMEIGRAANEQPAVPSCRAGADVVRVDADDAATHRQQFFDGRKPGAAESDDAGVGGLVAVERRQPRPLAVVPRGELLR